MFKVLRGRDQSLLADGTCFVCNPMQAGIRLWQKWISATEWLSPWEGE